jgi:hypothetical protein
MAGQGNTDVRGTLRAAIKDALRPELFKNYCSLISFIGAQQAQWIRDAEDWLTITESELPTPEISKSI